LKIVFYSGAPRSETKSPFPDDVNGRSSTPYEVVLLRHGEALGYDGDRGLTDRGAGV